MKCAICGFAEDDKKRFSNHLRKEHKLSSRDYTIKYLIGTAVMQTSVTASPTCAIANCSNPTRYVSFTFKEYCKEHSKMAMRKAGAIGGKAPAWNKGLTKNNDSRIAEQARKMSGDGNPFFGLSHSDAAKAKIRAAKRIDEATFKARVAERFNELECLTEYIDYVSRQHQYLQVRCRVCNFEDRKTLQAYERGSLCVKCHPNSESKAQLELLEWVRSLGVEAYSDKKTLGEKRSTCMFPLNDSG